MCVILLGCVQSWHFYRTLFRGLLFSGHSVDGDLEKHEMSELKGVVYMIKRSGGEGRSPVMPNTFFPFSQPGSCPKIDVQFCTRLAVNN